MKIRSLALCFFAAVPLQRRAVEKDATVVSDALGRPVKFVASLIATCALVVLAGCAAGPHLHINNAILNGGKYELGPEMRNRHMIATVGFDEAFTRDYSRVTKNILYVQGIVEGTPEYQYRVVLLTMGQIKGLAWYADGEYLWMTGALVPDHVGRLKAYDLVEFRQVTGNRSMENFSKTGEGNVIVKVLCRKADPAFEKCKAALPQLGKFGPSGDTGIPYPASVKGYGHSFTSAYDPSGALTRSIGEFFPKAP